MRWESLLTIVGSYGPIFNSGILLAGDVDPQDVRRQLSRWTAQGRLCQLRRGLYLLEPPYRATEVHPFVVAQRLVPGSRVSLQAALAHRGLIPEGVPVVTSVGRVRPQTHRNPMGVMRFRRLSQEPPPGAVEPVELPGGLAWISTGEQALLELSHLEAGGESEAFLRGLRLQNLEQVDRDRLLRFAADWGTPKMRRAASMIVRLADEDVMELSELAAL